MPQDVMLAVCKLADLMRDSAALVTEEGWHDIQEKLGEAIGRKPA